MAKGVQEAGIKPMLAVRVDDSLIAIDFQRRDFEKAITDFDYLRGMMPPETAERIIQGLSAAEHETGWERIMLYARLFDGFPGSGYDFDDMRYIFESMGIVCDLIDFRVDKTVKRESYRPEGEVLELFTPNIDYLVQERKKLTYGDPNPREIILRLCNTSHKLTRRALYEALEKELPVRFDIEEEDGLLTARQRVPRYANPVFSLEGLYNNGVGTASVKVRRYQLISSGKPVFSRSPSIPPSHPFRLVRTPCIETG